MQGKIALEEHFAIPATLADSKVFGAHVWKRSLSRGSPISRTSGCA